MKTRAQANGPEGGSRRIWPSPLRRFPPPASPLARLSPPHPILRLAANRPEQVAALRSYPTSMAAPSKLQRWLDIVAFLASRRLPVSTEDLWRAVPAYANALEDGEAKKGSAAERQFERDKKELREAGIPIETVAFSITYADGVEQSHGYRLERKNFHLPYLRLVEKADEERRTSSRSPYGSRPVASTHFELTPTEAAAALDGLRDVASLPAFPLVAEAKSAFRKLAFDIEADSVGSESVQYAVDAEVAGSAEALRLLSGALVRRKRVTLTYHSIQRDEWTERTVEPFGLLFQHGRWYMVARDPNKDPTPRMFRLGRMRDVQVNTKKPTTADYAIPSDFDLDEFGGRKAWELGAESAQAIHATVHFRFPRSLWADRNGLGTLAEDLEDGSQLRIFEVRRRDPFLRWVLSLGGDARIVGPADLHEEFKGMLDQVRAHYSADPSGETQR